MVDLQCPRMKLDRGGIPVPFLVSRLNRTIQHPQTTHRYISMKSLGVKRQPNVACWSTGYELNVTPKRAAFLFQGLKQTIIRHRPTVETNNTP